MVYRVFVMVFYPHKLDYLPPIQVPLDFKELFQDALETLPRNQVGKQSVSVWFSWVCPPIIRMISGKIRVI
jgi:hypothetical protein